SSRCRRPALRSRRPRLVMETLEGRVLLSTAPLAPIQLPRAVPEVMLAGDGAKLSPLGSPAPVGLVPAQVRHAYGIDQIGFNGVAGDGTGQTIAIVDAYDDPN